MLHGMFLGSGTTFGGSCTSLPLTEHRLKYSWLTRQSSTLWMSLYLEDKIQKTPTCLCFYSAACFRKQNWLNTDWVTGQETFDEWLMWYSFVFSLWGIRCRNRDYTSLMDRAYSKHRLFSSSHLVPISLFFCPFLLFFSRASCSHGAPVGEIVSHICGEDYFFSVTPVRVTKEQKQKPFLTYSRFRFARPFIVWCNCCFPLRHSKGWPNTGTSNDSNAKPPRIPCNLWVSETQRTSIHETLINKTWGGSFVWQVHRTWDYFCR